MFLVNPKTTLTFNPLPQPGNWCRQRLRLHDFINWHCGREFRKFAVIDLYIAVQYSSFQSLIQFIPILWRNLHKSPPTGNVPAFPPNHADKQEAHTPPRPATAIHQKHPCLLQYGSVCRVSKSCTVHHASGLAEPHRATVSPLSWKNAQWNCHKPDLTYRRPMQFPSKARPNECQVTPGRHALREWPRVMESYSFSLFCRPLILVLFPSADNTASKRK